MPRLMSVAFTEDAVRAGIKTVTRRVGWRNTKPGDRLTLCRKVMGRKRRDGTVEPLVRLAEVEVISARRERLWDLWDRYDDTEIEREGVTGVDWIETWDDTGQPTPHAWVAWYCETFGVEPDTEVTRIEWRYVGDKGQ